MSLTIVTDRQGHITEYTEVEELRHGFIYYTGDKLTAMEEAGIGNVRPTLKEGEVVVSVLQE